MRVTYIIVLSFILVSCQSKLKHSFSPPSTPSESVVDNYHGMNIEDPYRNLENLKNSEVIDWFKTQGAFSDSILKNIPGQKYLLEKQLNFENSQNQSFERLLITKNRSYFYIKRNTNENVGKLYYRRTKKSTEKLIYNPENFGSNYIINYFKVNHDISKIAISVVKKGEQESSIIIYDINSNKILPNVIKNASPALVGGISWLHDNSGFVYQYFPHFDYHDSSYLLNTKSVLHKIGSKNEKLFDIFSKNNNKTINFKEEDFPIISIRENQKDYVFGKISGVSDFENTFYSKISLNTNYQDLKWELLFSREEKIKQYSTFGDSLIYLTAKNSSNYKICKTSIVNPNFDDPIVVIEENSNEVIMDFEFIKGNLFYSTLKNGVESKFFVKKGKVEEEINLPFPSGSTYLLSAGNDLIVVIAGWTKPMSYYRYDVKNDEFTNIDLNKINELELDNFIVEEVEVVSHDKVKVPLSIIYKKGLSKNKKNRTILLSYGSYGDSFSPYFSIPFLTWVNEGGIWAVPHIRGGGEKGDAWHKAGFKTTKPNTWKDLIACSEYLIKEDYTSSDYLVNYGVSAAGIAVGRSMTERPDLYKVVAMDVPALNFLRSEIQPNGANSIKEFGTVKDSIEFRALLEMDSYHHIVKGESYPSVYISTGMNDGSVTPWDPAKFVARLQNSSVSNNPILFSVDFNAGHSGDGTMKKYYEDIAKVFSFALWQTGHPDYQPEN